jgi:hypothetical protein
VISPAIAGVLLAMQWQPAALFMIAAIPTVLASIGLFVLLRFLKARTAVTEA